MNHIVLIGRLTRDPELRYTPANGVAVATFTLAVNRRVKQGGQPNADFVPIVAWRNLAENCAKFLSKGSQCAVEGRLQIRSYEDKDGNRRTIAEVVAESVQFLDSKKTQGNSDAHDYSMNEMGGTEIDDDDVPF